MRKGILLVGVASQLLAEKSPGIGTGVQFPIITAPEPSALITLALHLLALVALVAIIRRKHSKAGR